MSGPRLSPNEIDDVLRWSIDVPLATNPYMVKLVAVCFVGGSLLSWSFLAIVLCLNGHWLLAGQTLMAFIVIGIVLTGFGVVIMLVVYGNRLPTRYQVTESGIRCESDDQKTHRIAAVILGIAALSGAPAKTVAPLAVVGSSSVELRFSDDLKVSIDQRRRVIGFRKGLRPVLRVHCLPENFGQVVDIVRHRMGRDSSVNPQ